MYFNPNHSKDDEQGEDYIASTYDDLPNNEFDHLFSIEFSPLEGPQGLLEIAKGLIKEQYLKS